MFLGDQSATLKEQHMETTMSTASVLPTKLPAGVIKTTPIAVADCRAATPTDLRLANATTMEEPLRRLLLPDEKWMETETTPEGRFPSEPAIIPLMGHLGQWRARPKITIPTRNNTGDQTPNTPKYTGRGAGTADRGMGDAHPRKSTDFPAKDRVGKGHPSCSGDTHAPTIL